MSPLEILGKYMVDYVTVAGSLAYGTNMPNSDVDWRGFFFPTFEHVVGLNPGSEVVQVIKDGEDVCFWEVRKFCRLALAANPNVLETLFARESQRYVTIAASYITDNKNLFLSRKIANTYLGYATGNYKRCQKASEIDWKDAMHMVRLLHTGAEALETGVLNVYRAKDKDYLIDIRKGLVSWPEIQNEFIVMEEKINRLKADSPLPEEPAFDKVNNILIGVMSELYRN